MPGSGIAQGITIKCKKIKKATEIYPYLGSFRSISAAVCKLALDGLILWPIKGLSLLMYWRVVLLMKEKRPSKVSILQKP